MYVCKEIVDKEEKLMTVNENSFYILFVPRFGKSDVKNEPKPNLSRTGRCDPSRFLTRCYVVTSVCKSRVVHLHLVCREKRESAVCETLCVSPRGWCTSGPKCDQESKQLIVSDCEKWKLISWKTPHVKKVSKR